MELSLSLRCEESMFGAVAAVCAVCGVGVGRATYEESGSDDIVKP
jgi:hypothetical protein